MFIMLIILCILSYMFLGVLWAVTTKHFEFLCIHEDELSYLVGAGIIGWPIWLVLQILAYFVCCVVYFILSPIHWFFYNIAKMLTDKR